MARNRPSTNALAIAGEFATLSQLALHGYDANVTLGHTKHVDILVSDPDSGGMYRVEVKTSGNQDAKGSAAIRSPFWGHCYAWRMSKKHEDIIDPSLFYCFVNFAGLERASFRFFIVPSEIVAGYLAVSHQLWLRGDPNRKDSAIREFRLALQEDGYPLPTPLAERYENNWSFER